MTAGTPTRRLIVLRGNSGSGKSALATAIRALRPERTLALVGQDIIRRQILGAGDGVGHPAIGLVDLTARYALEHGYDVVVEGIFNAERYGEMLRRLVADHRGVTRCYLYDLTFEETLRRHATKDVAGEFGEAEMREWWRGFEPVEGLAESVIGADESLDAAARRIVCECWG